MEMIYRGKKKSNSKQIEWQVFVDKEDVKGRGMERLLGDILGAEVDLKG